MEVHDTKSLNRGWGTHLVSISIASYFDQTTWPWGKSHGGGGDMMQILAIDW